MANGICVFAENCGGELDPIFAELVSAAREIKEITGEQIQALLVGKSVDEAQREIEKIGVDQVFVVRTDEEHFMQDDLLSQLIADTLQIISPSAVLVPATPAGRSVFSRVAAKLDCGLTADCTELLVGTRESGAYYIKQNKPSYGANVMVTIVTKEGVYPQMMTVRPGVYQSADKTEVQAKIIVCPEHKLIPSKIQVVEAVEAPVNADSIMSADIVVACGKGVLEEGTYELMERFAEKIGAAIGGTRPIADAGLIPFDHQIGQTGFTIRPKICISLGASGAIQHTEGIKDTKLMIAVNTDETAPIFNIADYGLLGDINEVLSAFLES